MKLKPLALSLLALLLYHPPLLAEDLLLEEETSATDENVIECAPTPDPRVVSVDAFNEYFRDLRGQYERDWSLAAAVTACEPEMVKTALKGGANPQTTVSFVYEQGSQINNNRWLLINGEYNQYLTEESFSLTTDDGQFFAMEIDEPCRNIMSEEPEPTTYPLSEEMSLVNLANSYCTNNADDILYTLNLYSRPYFANERAYNDWFWNLGTRAEKNLALQEAVQFGDARFVEIALNNGADVSDNGELATSLLFGAAIDGHTDIMVLLKKAGAKLDYTSDAAGDALIYAASTGKKSWVKSLVKGGVNVNYRDSSGQTAADAALNDEIRKLLK